MDASKLRDTIIQGLRDQKTFDRTATADINGNYFSAADIVSANADGRHEVYRIAVIKHNPQRNFT